jgi:dephospho-CoA kinase
VVILGLTGSIGMGKSAATRAFRNLGAPVHDADRAVHALMGPNAATVAAIEVAFPGVTSAGIVDREELAARVFDATDGLDRLEAIIHPFVEAGERRFCAIAARNRWPVVVLDIPLLFEIGSEDRCDAVVVVSAPRALQRARVLKRPGMTPVRLAAILARQMPDSEKCRRADFVIKTGLGRSFSLNAVRNVLNVARTLSGTHWPPPPASRGRGGPRIHGPLRIQT